MTKHGDCVYTDMGLFGVLRKLTTLVLTLIGLATVLFVVLSYGWDGEPPEISFEAADE